jgi:hypothetical protein
MSHHQYTPWKQPGRSGSGVGHHEEARRTVVVLGFVNSSLSDHEIIIIGNLEQLILRLEHLGYEMQSGAQNESDKDQKLKEWKKRRNLGKGDMDRLRSAEKELANARKALRFDKTILTYKQIPAKDKDRLRQAQENLLIVRFDLGFD